MHRHFITRRAFLRAAGTGSVAAAAMFRSGLALAQDATPTPEDELLSYNELFGNPPMLGRVHGAEWIRELKEPAPGAGTVGRYYWGDVLPILRGMRTVPYDTRAQSDVWFQTHNGYVHSAYVVPTREIFNEPVTDYSGDFWAEVTVPSGWQHYLPDIESQRFDWAFEKLYWGQVFKITDYREDNRGLGWYRVYDDIEPNRQAWVLARGMRFIDPYEFEPISTDIENKHITIELDGQLLSCYENGTEVFQTRIASGSSFQDDDGALVDFSTPYGDYFVQRKRPARRMRGGEGVLSYDVNAVPWVTYFTYTGAAIHGAYWHNNFGRPRSHGCINVTPDAAKWIYRWTAPHGSYDDDYLWTEKGEHATTIEIL